MIYSLNNNCVFSLVRAHRKGFDFRRGKKLILCYDFKCVLEIAHHYPLQYFLVSPAAALYSLPLSFDTFLSSFVEKEQYIVQ